MSYRGKNRRKPYFSSNLNSKKKKDLFLLPGMKGFICTCNGNERQCIRESYNILNEYGDRLYGEEKATKPEVSATVTDKGDGKCEDEDDEMDQFQKEVDTLKSQSKESNRRFQVVDAGIANCVFIKTNVDDPVSLTDTIMRDLADKKELKARFLLRMIPIEITCKVDIEGNLSGVSFEFTWFNGIRVSCVLQAQMDDIITAAAPLIDRYFKTEPLTYSIIISKRCNSSVDRDPLIAKLATMVQERNQEHKVNLSNPTISIIVEAMKGICGLAVIRDYFQLGKYNLRQVCGFPLNDEATTVESSSKPSQESEDTVTNTDSVPEESVDMVEPKED